MLLNPYLPQGALPSAVAGTMKLDEGHSAQCLPPWAGGGKLAVAPTVSFHQGVLRKTHLHTEMLPEKFKLASLCSGPPCQEHPGPNLSQVLDSEAENLQPSCSPPLACLCPPSAHPNSATFLSAPSWAARQLLPFHGLNFPVWVHCSFLIPQSSSSPSSLFSSLSYRHPHL